MSNHLSSLMLRTLVFFYVVAGLIAAWLAGSYCAASVRYGDFWPDCMLRCVPDVAYVLGLWLTAVIATCFCVGTVGTWASDDIDAVFPCDDDDEQVPSRKTRRNKRH